ncbi:hypothetical protein N7488_002620 [Penicillium malachiteum]|nr:hypothetical protein N7488_002620 [Penicillium malachiteum]
MADDHASKAISCYGAGINNTPNLDRIANEGMKFNHCYVTNSICTPSRAAILTGTHNHVNGVMTLDSKINKHLPNVAKHLRVGGYQTAMVGKWHLGEGEDHEPTGFDYWEVVPGARYNQAFLPYVSSHRSWECDYKHKDLYKDPIKVPDTFTDDYKNRAKSAAASKMRVADDLTYMDLGLVQPDGPARIVGEKMLDTWNFYERKIPNPEDVTKLKLIDKEDGTVFTFKTSKELAEFKFQRVDDNVGRMLDYLDAEGLSENTLVIYTSDQGFFLGEHGWFDKRLVYENSSNMPFLIKYPREIAAGSVCNDIICNVDFAPTWLDFAKLRLPTYMQGVSFRALLQQKTPADWQQVAYHRYWMHRDIIHDAHAHYAVRDKRYKLIYWYNESFGIEGARLGGEEKEWELFDLDEDPLELFNCYHESKYSDVVKQMTQLLEQKMDEIGDEPVHPRY